MLVLGFALPQTDEQGVVVRDLLGDLWAIALFVGVYALVSMGIGSLLRSNGAAITVALVINFALTPVIILIASWSERVASFALPVALGTLTGDDDTEISIGLAAVAVRRLARLLPRRRLRPDRARRVLRTRSKMTLRRRGVLGECDART